MLGKKLKKAVLKLFCAGMSYWKQLIEVITAKGDLEGMGSQTQKIVLGLVSKLDNIFNHIAAENIENSTVAKGS